MCAVHRLVVALLVLTLSGGATLAQDAPRAQVPGGIRPLTLPAGALEATLLGNYTNWGGSGLRGALAGESAAVGLDFGVTDSTQLGLAVALPIHPGASFGSALLNGLFAVSATFAMRVDVGVERIGGNGGPAGAGSHAVREFVGFGPYARVPLAPGVDLLWGRSGASRAFRFANTESGGLGMGFYRGGSYWPGAAGSDALVVSTGDNQSGTVIGVNLPLGLMVRPVAPLSLTLQAGYSTVMVFDDGFGALHYLPVGLEAVLSPIPRLDVGLNLTFDGYVATTNGRSTLGYFDQRSVLLWFRVHTGA